MAWTIDELIEKLETLKEFHGGNAEVMINNAEFQTYDSVTWVDWSENENAVVIDWSIYLT